MKKLISSLLLAACVIGIASCQKRQQPQPPQQNQQTNNQPSGNQFPTFNPKSVETFKGQVVQIISISDPESGQDVLGILLRTPKGDIPVQLGPSSYVQGGQSNLQPMQEVEIKGSVLNFDGQIFVIAQELKTKDYTLKLRDDKGTPLWSGWKKS